MPALASASASSAGGVGSPSNTSLLQTIHLSLLRCIHPSKRLNNSLSCLASRQCLSSLHYVCEYSESLEDELDEDSLHQLLDDNNSSSFSMLSFLTTLADVALVCSSSCSSEMLLTAQLHLALGACANLVAALPANFTRPIAAKLVDAAAVCAHNAPTPAVNLASNVFAQDQESISGTTPETQAKWRNLLAAQLGNIEDTDDVDSAIAVIVDALCHEAGDVREAAAAAAAAGPDAVSAVACAACRSQDGAADALARALFEDAWALADDATKGLDNIDDIITVLRRHAKKSPRAAETLRALQSGEENKKDDDGDDNRNPAALERLLGDHANKASTTRPLSKLVFMRRSSISSHGIVSVAQHGKSWCVLRLGCCPQGCYHTDDGDSALGFDYVRALAACASPTINTKAACLSIGLGAGSLPRFFARRGGFGACHVLELDAAVVEACKTTLHLRCDVVGGEDVARALGWEGGGHRRGQGVRVWIGDGADALPHLVNDDNTSYAAIFVDAYDSRGRVPTSFYEANILRACCTLAARHVVQTRLPAVVVANVFDGTAEARADLLSLATTLNAESEIVCESMRVHTSTPHTVPLVSSTGRANSALALWFRFSESREKRKAPFIPSPTTNGNTLSWPFNPNLYLQGARAVDMGGGDVGGVGDPLGKRRRGVTNM